MQRHMIVGLAKSGTTAISKTIQNTSGIDRYKLEPTKIRFFEELGGVKDDIVVKILFNNWQYRKNLLRGIVANEMKTNFSTITLIVRDPRAVLVSLLLYTAYGYFRGNKRSEQEKTRWIEIFQAKEQDPSNVTFRDLSEALFDEFGVFGDKMVGHISGTYRNYQSFITEMQKKEHVHVLRYEDFVSENLSKHPLKNLLSGERDVGSTLQRTNRTSGREDWGAFILPSDSDWLNSVFGETLDHFNYPKSVCSNLIVAKNCTGYIRRIIRETETAST